MSSILITPNAAESVRRLEAAYTAYLKALGDTVAFQDVAVPGLVAALDHKKAMPIIEALGHLMGHPLAQLAIPRLLDFAFGQFPVFPEMAAAVVRAGEKATPYLLARLEEAVEQDDDEALRNLLDIGVQLPERLLPRLAERVLLLLQHRNPHIREAASDAFLRLGLPHGRKAIPRLTELAAQDNVEAVRTAAEQALTRLK